MAKRELSSTLKNLKFMQRAANREEKTKKDEEVKADDNFISPGTVRRKCVIIMEGDPHPGAVLGRMSFQSFNPSIDKLNERAANIHQPESSAIHSHNQTGTTPSRENGSSQDGAESVKVEQLNHEVNEDHKRKQTEVVSEPLYPNKSSKNFQGSQKPSSSNHKGSQKQQPKRNEKLDWRVLRPPKSPNKKEKTKLLGVYDLSPSAGGFRQTRFRSQI